MTERNACRTGRAARHLSGGALIAAALLAAGPARAADGAGKYAIDGAGRATCSSFLAARKADNTDYRLFAGWVDGYVTAFNRFDGGTFDLTPWQSVELLLAKLAKYCETAPDDHFINALNKLASVLYESRLTEESSVLQLRAGKQAVLVYKALLPHIHAALVKEGLDAGEDPEGYTDAMAAALRSLQKSRGIAVSGLPDQVTLNALFP